MMKIELIKIVYGMAAAMLAGFSSCSHEIPLSHGEGEIALLSTRGSEMKETGNSLGADFRPVFLFLGKDDEGNFSAKAPFFAASNVPADVNAYETDAYNTQKAYPPLPRELLASGYIPQTLKPQPTTDQYMKLSLPTGTELGRTVLMAPDTVLFGSASDPFDLPGKRLRFRHLQSRLLFRAILKEGFPADFYRVDKVCVTINKASLADGIVWDPSTRLYKANAATSSAGDPGVSFGQGATDLDGNAIAIQQLTLFNQALINGTDNNDYRDLGGLYVLPEISNIEIAQVSARIYPINTPEDDKDLYIRKLQDLVVTFNDNSNAPQILKEGESWLITLFFEFDGIELTGQKINWDKGGNIIIPVPISETN